MISMRNVALALAARPRPYAMFARLVKDLNIKAE